MNRVLTTRECVLLLTGSRVIGVEPNPYFVDELLKLKDSCPNLVKVIRGFAEDLSDISNESVDAVVSTLVLCSVKDLDKSIKEVKRVLVKVSPSDFESCALI